MTRFIFDDFMFDDVSHKLTRAGKQLRAEAQVLKVLRCLLEKPGEIVTKAELIDRVWCGSARSSNAISASVTKLRKALGNPNVPCVASVYGRGYRFLRSLQRIEASRHEASHEGRPLLGRRGALEHLDHALSRARSGRGSVCAIVGELGIGKTRLAETLGLHARGMGFAVSWSHCALLGNAAELWPFTKLLHAWDHEATARRATGIEKDDVEPASEKTQASRRKIKSTTIHAIKQRALEQPQLIVLEDVHWADVESLRLLSALLSFARDHRLLLVFTVRDDVPNSENRRRVLERLLAHRECKRFVLSPLSRQQVRAYAQRVLGELDTRVTEAVFAKSQGNPLLMVELLRPFEHLAAKPRPEDIRMPTFIVELARETLRRIEPRVREILAAASILGGTFGLGSLSQLVETSPHELLELLERATDIRWVMRVHDDPDHFSFKHNVIREVLYRDTPSVVRVRLHARARTLADRMSRGDGSISIQAIAHHLLAGVPVVSALEAALSAREAAMAGAHSGSHSEASELMRRAVAVLCTHAATETEALRETLLNLARYERLAGEPFSEHLAQAIKLAPRSRTHLPRV